MKKSKPSTPPPTTAPLAAQDLWLAGLDAFSQATKAATEAASQAATQAAGRVATLAASAAAPPSLEGLFEARVAKAMTRLGTPTRAELDALTAQVAHLQASLKAALQTSKAAQGKPPAKAPKVPKTASAPAPTTTQAGEVGAKRSRARRT